MAYFSRTTWLAFAEIHSHGAEEALKEQFYLSRYETAGVIQQVSRRSEGHIDALQEIDTILATAQTDDGQKVALIRGVMAHKKLTAAQLIADEQRLETLKTINQPVQERADFYQALEGISQRLQLRVSAILQVLTFESTQPPTYLGQAIDYYQHRAGELTATSALPLDFLDMTERQHIFTTGGKLRLSLYKVLLFRAVCAGLREGTLAVLSSYEYRSVDEYLIPADQWQTHREEYLQRAGLIHLRRSAPVLTALNERLNAQFAQTNGRLATNAQVYYDAGGGWHLHRYRAETDDQEADVRSLYPASRVVSLREVLTQVDKLTGFLGCFAHKGLPQKPTRPPAPLLQAAIIGYGENIGIRKMALISRHLEVNRLETVATQYFSPEMTLAANDCILTQSNALPLTALYSRPDGLVHTGSDGQKYDVSLPSLRAAASFKYYGNGEGVVVYSGLDKAGQLIYSTVFTASERESPYVLDVILSNQVVQSEAHSTDMHGFSEPNFALTGLLGVDFRPRFKTIHSQQLYSLDAVANYKALGYKLVPQSRVDYEYLVEHWDELLRFLTTIKLGYSPASTLLKRLNSYARMHPLYRALKALGRLYKTDYILRYVDEEALRKSVEGVLSKVEHSNRLSHAVTLGNQGAFGWRNQYEVDVANGCRRLIMNAINFYNLLLLSDKLNATPLGTERSELLTTILRTSTHTWHHINLQGEYDFSESAPVESWFNLELLKNVSLTLIKK